MILCLYRALLEVVAPLATHDVHFPNSDPMNVKASEEHFLLVLEQIPSQELAQHRVMQFVLKLQD